MQKIVIDNFGPVKHAKIEIKPLLVLIGEQATGKSTIAKLIYFFKSLSGDFRKHYYESKESRINFIDDVFLTIFDKFFEYFGNLSLWGTFEITYFYSDDKYVKLTSNDENGFEVQRSKDFFGEKDRKQLISCKEKLLKLKQEIEDEDSDTTKRLLLEQKQLELLNEFTSIINEIFCNVHNDSSYIIAGRNATIGYSSFFEGMLAANLQKRIEDIGSNASETKEQTIEETLMLDFLQRVSKMRQLFYKSNDFEGLIKIAPKEKKEILTKSYFLIKKIIRGDYASGIDEKIKVEGGKFVYLKNASSGQQESIRILQDAFLGINSGNNVFRVIEEPEAHIFPEAQMYLLQLLAILLNNTENNQLIITTHSPYVLTVINNLMHAYSVGQNNPEKVREIVNEYSWIDPKKVNAYMLTVANGAERIIDDEVNMIDAEKIDGVSEKLNKNYDKLLDIEYGNGEEK